MLKVVRKIIVAMVVICVLSSVSMAAIVPLSNTFTGSSSIAGWYNFTGGGDVVISYLNGAGPRYDWADNDDTAIQSALNSSDPLPAGGTITGDGLLADGALKMDVTDSTAGDDRIAYNLSGTIEEGEVLTFSYNMFNQVAYFNEVTGYFYDLTAGVQLTPDSWISCLAVGIAAYKPMDGVATYTGTVETAGHQIAIVFREWANSYRRDPYIDNITVTSFIPEPATIALFGLAAILMRRKG